MKWLLRLLGYIFFLSTFGTLILYFQGKLGNVIPAATFSALFGVFLSESSKVADKQTQRSKFFLEQSLAGFEHTVNLLSDRNNNRTKWISAARILQQSLELSKKITETEHKSILQIEMDRYRHQLWEILNPYDERITPAFFYGVSDYNLDIQQAAKLSSLPTVGEPQGRLSSIHSLSEKSLFVIWSFMEFPDNYADPLHNTFSQEQIEKLRLQHRPLYEYLEHKQTYHPIAGKPHKLSDKEE
ncbi:hypothetical protein [Calothrix sp. NIES-2098]|uniref:hypothetical protein n=1 Tax=Calothrix sp. NIES-2098 TaxID=1954171 RepID=UPI000B603CB3|nr:hypothetical protein NIES2098_51680 [Calothrix sp. NIES-2098]